MKRFQRPAGWGDLSPVVRPMKFSAAYWYREGSRWVLRVICPACAANGSRGIYELEGQEVKP